MYVCVYVYVYMYMCQSIEINNNKHVCMYTYRWLGARMQYAVNSIANALGLLQFCTKPWIYLASLCLYDLYEPYDSRYLGQRWLRWRLPTWPHLGNFEGTHDDVIKWKHFLCYWPFVRGTHRSPVNSPHKGQWRGALMFSFICARINSWASNGGAGDLRRRRAHYDVIMVIVTSRGKVSMVTPFSKANKGKCHDAHLTYTAVWKYSFWIVK